MAKCYGKEKFVIEEVHGLEVLDSRGNPTVEVTVRLKSGAIGKAMVPSGASTGRYEAVELRDEEKRFGGKGVERAVTNVNTRINDRLCGCDALNQREIDRILIEADGTENKGKYGANAILGVSLATAKAAADALGIPLYRYIGGVNGKTLPVPMMNVINGGAHAKNSIDFQEFMIMPAGACCFKEGLRMCGETYQKLKEILKNRNLSTGVGDEGGFAPDVKDAREIFELMSLAVREAGYEPGKEISFAMDAAASELYLEKENAYYFPGESSMKGEKVIRTAEEMVEYYEKLAGEYPLISIEDGLWEDDWSGWKLMTEKLGGRVQLVGDDLFVTNVKRIRRGICEKAGNAVLIKVNQIGTLTEAIAAVRMTQKAGWHAVISHRSGESEDTFIADLAVAVGAGQIKTGAPCRGERTAKYNRLLAIEDRLGSHALYLVQ